MVSNRTTVTLPGPDLLRAKTSTPVPDLSPANRSKALQGWHSFSDQEPNSTHPTTLSQEARNTERHASFWGSASRLRDNKIQFVSAGKLSMEQSDGEPEDIEEDANPTAISEAENFQRDTPETADQTSLVNLTEVLPEVPSAPQSDPNVESEDQGHTSMTEQVRRMEITADPLDSGLATSVEDVAHSSSRPRSTTKSSTTSDDEVIVFGGRGADRKRDGQRAETPVAARSSENVTPAPTRPAFATPKPNFGRRRGRRGPRQPTERELEEEALIQDYIENMKDEESEEEDDDAVTRNEHHRFFGGAGEENVKVQTLSRGKEKLPDNIDDELGWSSGDLEDFDDLSTTDDEVVEVSQVVSHRVRQSGPQYLVTAAGTDLGEARWVLHEKLTSTTATIQIQIFEEAQMNKMDLEDGESGESSTESDEEALNDLLDAIESADDENDRLMKRTAKMSDAQIARALTLQEELGMDSKDVLLFDGQEDDDDNDAFANGDGFIPFSSKRHVSNRTRSKQTRRKKDTFPSAEAFADALDQDPYGGFDVMDFDRPSLKPKRKGRKSAGLPFELEDEDLASQLQQSWENDRSKKAVRKREREEMRQAGLLGSKASNGRIDLFTKYQDSGMDADQIKTEIRSFLLQQVEALALAPMAADMRASVHRLAKALSLKSHSQGKADGRFPILTKTHHTPFYTFETIYEVDALMSKRKFFPKNTGFYKSLKQPRSGPKARRSGGGGVLAGTSYMDGEVVGASAPEIGAENRGRAMLEKMGWSSGMGIGKVGNKGSIEVIKHVVKNTKAGLG